MPCIAKCPYCGETIRGRSEEAVQKLYRQHLLDRHDDVLSERLEKLCRKGSCPSKNIDVNKRWLAGFLAALVVHCDED